MGVLSFFSRSFNHFSIFDETSWNLTWTEMKTMAFCEGLIYSISNMIKYILSREFFANDLPFTYPVFRYIELQISSKSILCRTNSTSYIKEKCKFHKKKTKRKLRITPTLIKSTNSSREWYDYLKLI